MAAFCAISSGIPPHEKPFWQSFSVEDLHSLYQTLSATPGKVLALLEEPVESSEAQLRVYNYLLQFVGDMENAEVRQFLRFTTGSSVLTAQQIFVSFNSLSGLGRRPIAHTCGCTIELPSTYTSYIDFEQEFKAVLADNEYSWQMDAI